MECTQRGGTSGEGVEGTPVPSTSSDQATRTFPWTPGVNPAPWQVDVDGAREEARRQVAQMLQRPEDLARLPELKDRIRQAHEDLGAGPGVGRGASQERHGDSRRQQRS